MPGYFALRHPIQVFRYLRSPSRLARLLGGAVAPEALLRWMGEADRITQEIQARFAQEKWGQHEVTGSSASKDRGPVLYALVRGLRPEITLETGVASGSSSYYILAALRDNERGVLHSVDLPPQAWASSEYRAHDHVGLPMGREPGWLVPTDLRSRWTLHLGDTRTTLPQVLGNVPSIDLFFHDSEHTDEVMRFEYSQAWPRIRPGGVLGSDDINRNHAFRDLRRQATESPVLVGGFGFLRKPGLAPVPLPGAPSRVG